MVLVFRVVARVLRGRRERKSAQEMNHGTKRTGAKADKQSRRRASWAAGCHKELKCAKGGSTLTMKRKDAGRTWTRRWSTAMTVKTPTVYAAVSPMPMRMSLEHVTY